MVTWLVGERRIEVEERALVVAMFGRVSKSVDKMMVFEMR